MQDAITAVEHGQADWVAGLIPRAQYRQLSLKAPAQLHSSPEFTVDFAPINTHLAPFNSILVRQALNYAINRLTIVRLYGGPAFATATCQVIAPGLPGYRRYCPYTLHPRADGAYTGPNLARARRLVAKSGTSGERVALWGVSSAYVPLAVPQVRRRDPALPWLPSPPAPHPLRQHHRGDVPGIPAVHRRRLACELPRPVVLRPPVLRLRRRQRQRLLLQPAARPARCKTPSYSRTPRSS